MFRIPEFAVSALALLGANITKLNSASPSDDFHQDYRESDFGLKLLAEGVQPTVDVVLLHGLDGHWRRSWTAENGVYWPEELLPSLVPQARIFSYGYDVRTMDSTPLSSQYLHEHATKLIVDLTWKREMTNTQKRPIIFVAHSLGGILLKVALKHSDDCSKHHLESHKSIVISTVAVFFMGTPHQGASGVSLKDIILRVQSPLRYTSNKVSKHLALHSEFLQEHQARYLAIAQNFETTFFYETLPMVVGAGQSILLVPSHSAIIQGQANSEVIGLAGKDHSTMVKFGSPDEEGLEKISWKILHIARKAPKTVEKNWQEWDNSGHYGPSSVVGCYQLPFEVDTRKNHHFTGREDLLESLQTYLLPENPNQVDLVPVVLHGLGGIGKTQIAREYVERHRGEYDSIHWIDGTTEESIGRGFHRLAERIIARYDELELNDTTYSKLKLALNSGGIFSSHPAQAEEPIIKAVKMWLDEKPNTNWLLVFDNVDDLAFPVEKFFPNERQGHILITTRRLELTRWWHGIEVEPMKEKEGLQMLRTSAQLDIQPGSETYDQALTLLETLGYLPLALEQADSFIYNLQLPSPISEYLKMYRENGQFLLNQTASPKDFTYRAETVFTTWEISFAAINKTLPQAADLLLMCSFFANNDLWEDLFRPGIMPTRDGPSIQVILMSLKSYSLVQRKGSSDAFSIHPLVHYWARERLTPDLKQTYTRRSLSILTSAVERSKERPDYVFKFERRVVPHLDAAIRCAQNYLTDQGSLEKLSVPADYWTYGGLGQLLLNIEGFYLWGQWLLQEGLLHLEQRLLGRITLFRYHWRQIYKLAYILPLETRREVYRLCLLEAWKALPRKHPWALEVAGDLSWTILNQNIPYCCVIPSHHADQAWEWYNWTLSARRAVLGRSHPATMGAVKGIGQVLEAKCMFPEALKELEKALSVRAHYLGYGDILTRNVIDDVTVLFQQWHECEGPGLEQALFEYLNKTKDIGEYQLVPSRIDLINIYNSLTHVSHEINERNGLATCQGLLLANKLSKPSDRFLWSELQTVIIEVAESLDGDAALPCVLFYLEEMSEAILSRSRRLDDVTYMGRIDSSPSLDLSLYWVIDVVSFKLKELGELEASLDLCQRLLKLLDQLDEEEYSENFLATSKLAIFVSWDLAKTLNSLGRTEEAFKMSDRARLGWRLFISMPKFFYWDPPMWTETAKWYERLGRYDLAVGLYMELIGLSKVIRWYPDAKWETIKELYVTIARAYHASGDLYKTLGWIYLILKEPTNTVASAEVNAEFHREAINGMFNEDGNQEQELFSQELRLIVTQGRPHLFETSFCPGAFDIWPWEGEDHLVCDSFAPSPYATYSRTCPAVYLPTVLDRAMIIKEQNSLLDLLFAAEGHWSDYV